MADDVAAAPSGASARELASQLRASLSSLKSDVRTSFRLCGRDFGVLGAELVAALESGRRRERAAADALAHERTARGQLETRLAELQGNIRVLCRVRPLAAAAAGSSGEESDAASPDKRVQVESAQELSVFSPVDGARYKSFSFARVFHEQHSQLTVFKEVAPLVRAAVEGHHACVFAYGQTGAGKTHTMQGSDRGLCQRAAELIYSAAQQQQHVYEFRVSVQVVEVYNEEIYDLLAASTTSSSSSGASTMGAPAVVNADRGSPSSAATLGCHVGATSMCGNHQPMNSPSTVEIRHGERGVYLKNVESVAAPSVKELHDAIARSRAKSDRSNRAHTVVMIDIRRTSKANGDEDIGRLALVDLAGSERLSKTADTPAITVRESQHINKSLAAVGDVLAALLAKEKHIPFRNTKLTHLLQDSLSGSANRTLLLVHVSPKSADVNETINSLKFASRVSHIQMGKSQRTERAEITRLNGVVANQVSQIQALQEKLTAELELRKKYEKRLEEYRQEEHRRRSKGDERRILQQLRTPSPELPPPITSRRWSLYARKEKLANAQGLNGIENVAENILRGNESSPETAEIRTTSGGKPSGISPPTNFSRRLSLSALDQNAKPPSRAAQTGKRKRTAASEKVRSILKKRRGSDEVIDLTGTDSKQVSFDLSLATGGTSALPSRELTGAASASQVAAGGAVRVLASTRSATPARRVASTSSKRVKPKWNGWR